MKLLSGGESPGSQGGRVKLIDVFSETRSLDPEKVTRDRPFSIVMVDTLEQFVTGGREARRKDSIASYSGCLTA